MKSLFIYLSGANDRHANLQRALAHSQIQPSTLWKVAHGKNGKPQLLLNGAAKLGFSLSHAEGIEVVALLEEDRELGVDVELWPQRETDLDFLQTIASEEDRKVVAKLTGGKHDAGVALWVLKEAALKCSGEVMTDPRELSAIRQFDNVFLLKSSAFASAPHPEIDVALHVLTSEKDAHQIFLLAVAMPAGSLHKRPIKFEGKDWRLSPFQS